MICHPYYNGSRIASHGKSAAESTVAVMQKSVCGHICFQKNLLFVQNVQHIQVVPKLAYLSLPVDYMLKYNAKNSNNRNTE